MTVGDKGADDALKQGVVLEEEKRDEHHGEQSHKGTGDHRSHRADNAAHLVEVNHIPEVGKQHRRDVEVVAQVGKQPDEPCVQLFDGVCAEIRRGLDG